MIKRLLGTTVVKWYRSLIRNSKYRWLILLATLGYVVSPLDISPDILPVIGWIDDGLIATLAITEVAQLLADRKRKAAAQVEVGQPVYPASHAILDVDAVSVN